MPHINLLWPFIPYHFDKIKNLISSDPDFKKIKPFMINLNTFTNSPGSKYLTISVESILPNNDAEKDNNLRVNTKNVNASTTNNKTNTQKKKNNNKGPLENPLTNLYKVLHRLFPLCGKKVLSFLLCLISSFFLLILL